MTMDRRGLLRLAGLSTLGAALPRLSSSEGQAPDAKADYTLHIGTGLLELSPTHIISSTPIQRSVSRPPPSFQGRATSRG